MDFFEVERFGVHVPHEVELKIELGGRCESATSADVCARGLAYPRGPGLLRYVAAGVDGGRGLPGRRTARKATRPASSAAPKMTARTPPTLQP
jgi:hypothetical protein